MLFNDLSIQKALEDGAIGLDPYEPDLIQPSSIDMRLSDEFLIFSGIKGVDLKEDNSSRMTPVVAKGHFDLKPKQFALASTVEVLTLSSHLAARVEGKSSLGRLGLMVHITAGFIDPGFQGQVTLELCNMLPVTIRLYPGMPVAQLAVFEMTGAASSPYSGKYQGQSGPAQSRYHLNFVRK